MSGYGELRGVGGWLAFFLVAFGILSPLTALFSIVTMLYGAQGGAAVFGDAWMPLQIFEWAVIAVSFGGIWFAVWRMLQVHNWQSVRITIATIWLVGPAMVLVEAAGVAWLFGLSFGETFAGAGPDVVRPFIFATIWTIYLLKSERVANTYPQAPEVEEMAETFA